MERKLSDIIASELGVSEIGAQAIFAIRNKTLPISSFRITASYFRLDDKYAAQIIGLTETDYLHHNSAEPISIQASEMTIKLAELYDIGLNAFDSNKEKMLGWMNASIRALDGWKPINLINSMMGIELVKEEFLRIEYSNFS